MLNRLLILILGVLASVSALAQQHAASYFRLDTIPPIGYIVLDSGWRFHAGDNAEWAKPSLNDSDWQPINPVNNIDELPQMQNAGIGWLRLTLLVPAHMQGKTMTMGIFQVGASEIYFNGKLVEQYGTVSPDFNKEVTFNPYARPLYIEFAKQPVQVLAVRYSFNERNLKGKDFSSFFSSAISTPAFHWNYFYNSLRILVLDSVNGGIFFILCILQLFLFISNPGQKVNLYFILYAFGQFLFNSFGAFAGIFIHSSASLFYAEMGYRFCDAFSKVFYLFSVYQLFHQSKGLWFKIVVACGLASQLFIDMVPPALHTGVFFILTGIVHLEVLRVSLIAMQKKIRGAKIFFSSQLLVVLFLVLLGLNNVFNILGPSAFRMIFIAQIFVTPFLSFHLSKTNYQLKYLLE